MIDFGLGLKGLRKDYFLYTWPLRRVLSKHFGDKSDKIFLDTKRNGFESFRED